MSRGGDMYAVIDIPRFPLQAVLRLEADLGRRPVVLVDASMAKPLVVDCTVAAQRSGVMAGLSVAQAIARCEEIAVRYCSEKAEALAERALFDCAYSLSPRVEESAPGICSISLAGVGRTGLEERCDAIVSTLKGLGLSGRMGIASTPDLALLVARESKRVMVVGLDFPESKDLEAFLDALPIAATEPSESLGAILGQWGIRSAGAFARLPRESVGKRLGTEGLAFWDRISGREERPLRISKLPEVYEESLEFEYEIDTLEPALFVMRRFLDSLCLRLKGAALVADSVHARLDLADIRLEDGERVEGLRLSLKIPDPTSDADSLLAMLATRLEQMETDAAIVGIALKIDPIDRNENQLGLFETSLKNPHRLLRRWPASLELWGRTI